MSWHSSRSKLIRQSKTGGWGRQIIYFLAIMGGLTIVALFFLAYQALQVPADRLSAAGWLPPQSWAGAGRLEPWPLPTGPVAADAAADAGQAAGASAYAAFHLTKPQSSDLTPGQGPRPRAKAKGRPASAKRIKQPS